jgi:hypothetical protein
MKSKIASAISSVMAGSAINNSRPMLAGAPSEPDPPIELLEPLGAPELDPDGVGIRELDAASRRPGGKASDWSMIGSTFRFNRADSFCNPNRTPEYFPVSFKFGAINV